MSSTSPESESPAPRPVEQGPSRRRPRRHRGAGARVMVAVREVLVVVASALVLSLLVKTLLVQAFFIPSASMEGTLLVGDRVLVSLLTPGPFDLRRGDVVVFSDTEGWLAPTTATTGAPPLIQGARNALTFVGLLPQTGEAHLIKRVIGLPGDHVVCCDAEGLTTVNGVAVDESPYLRPGSIPSQLPFDVTVPAGSLWVEGDNRQDSEDSRFHQELAGGGSVPESSVVGRAVVRVWPLDRWGWLSDHPEVFRDVPAAGSPSG